MRIFILAGFCVVNALFPLLFLGADEEIRPTFINVRTSTTKICLNESVRIEFTTMPRDIETVDIANSVTNSLRLGEGVNWYLIAPPIITEAPVQGRTPPPVDPTKPPPVVRDRPKIITVVFNLSPRIIGEQLALPSIPITWLLGNQIAPLPPITVEGQIKVGASKQDLPKEVSGVAGMPWLAKFSTLKASFPPNSVETAPGQVRVKLLPNLTLNFTGDILSGATLVAPQLTLEQARVEFLKHWGIPQGENPTTLSWTLGWTNISAKQVPSDGGVVITLTRDDVLMNIAHNQVSNQIFSVLDNATADSPEQVEKRRAQEAAEALEHPAQGTVPPPPHP